VHLLYFSAFCTFLIWPDVLMCGINSNVQTSHCFVTFDSVVPAAEIVYNLFCNYWGFVEESVLFKCAM